jgi:hypothetical protein
VKLDRLAEIDQLAAAGKGPDAIKAADKFIADYKLTGKDLQGVLYKKAFIVLR